MNFSIVQIKRNKYMFSYGFRCVNKFPNQRSNANCVNDRYGSFTDYYVNNIRK